jgi:serine/threonine-protein kinase
LKCPECGAKNLPEAEHCVACGEPLTSEDEGAPDPRLGRVLGGKLRLDSILGEGSMGCVYAAHQLELDAEVAVKVLHDHVAADPKVAKRFHREARTASRLTHPNTLRVFDFGREDDGKLLYLVMELLDGPDLLELAMEEGPFTPRRIGELVGGVLAALEEAHDAGIVHRDLKPENILVVTDHQGREHPKVCDFGLAKLVEHEGSAITVTGFVCGTPEYMAPEQARGEALDARADLYAVGGLLYLLLTGEVPFKGASALATITEHLTRPVEPPSQRAPNRHVPYALERVCLRALRKNRDERFANAAEMRQALEEAVSALGPLADRPLGSFTEDPTRPKRPSKWKPWHAAVAGGFVLGAVVWATTREPATTRSGAVRDPEAEVARDAGSSGTFGSSTSDGGTDAGFLTDAGVVADAGASEDASSDAGGTITESTTRDAGRRRSPATTGTTPTSTPTTTSASDVRATFEEGRRLFLANDVRGAIARFEEVARLRPNDPEVHKQLGRAWMRAGDVASARRAYRRYLELAPNAPDRTLIEQIISD